jgi:hypothetical protein
VVGGRRSAVGGRRSVVGGRWSAVGDRWSVAHRSSYKSMVELVAGSWWLTAGLEAFDGDVFKTC